MNYKALIIFCRVPQKSKVKTRIAEKLGDSFTLGLYSLMLADILNTTKDIDADRIIYYTPSDADTDNLALFEGIKAYPQSGADLGERMFHAIEDSIISGYERVVLIGSDSPDLSQAIPEIAFHSLEKNDAVIGPSHDGGYYLIGINASSLSRTIFQDIEWSTSSVYEMTIKKLRLLRLNYCSLNIWYDIDTTEDLEQFYTRNLGKMNDLLTMQYLAEKINSWRK